MNKAFVHVMVDATWIWDSVLCRMDWANKEGLEFIGISNLNDLQKIRYNDDLPWVYQLNTLSRTDLPLKGAMEKISFPNDVVLNCWVKNHEVQEGHPGLWIILKEDHVTAPSTPSVEKEIEKEVDTKVKEIEALPEPFGLVKPESKKRDVVTPAFSKLAEKNFEKPDIEISLKPTTLIHETPQHVSEPLEEQQEEKQDNNIKKDDERRDSTKILALIARQINAQTGIAPFQKRASTASEKSIKNDLIQKSELREENTENHQAVSRNVSDYIGAETPKVERPKDAAPSLSPSNIENTSTSIQKENKPSSPEQSKVSLPGMAELIKQMRQSDGLKSSDSKPDVLQPDALKPDALKAVDQDISKPQEHHLEENQRTNREALQPENMPIVKEVTEETKPTIQSVSNSEGIPNTKITSNTDDNVETSIKDAPRSKEPLSQIEETHTPETKKYLPPLKQTIEQDAEQSMSHDRISEATDHQVTHEDTPNTAENTAVISEFTPRSMYDFPVASAMANEKGEFIAASELFSLAMGYHDEEEFLEEAQFEKVLPHIFTALIKQNPTQSRTNFFENSAGLTKSGRKMKLSLSAKSVKTPQGMTHFMILYPTGVDVPVISQQPVKTKIKQDDTLTQDQVPKDSINLPLLSSQPVDGKEGGGLKDEYERTLPFLAKISHEIRTPLNSIIGFSEIMKEEQFGPVKNERYLGYMDDIFVSANHALSLVNDMLDISRIQAGSMEVELEDLDLNEHVQSAIKSMAPQFASKDIHVWQGLSDKKLSVKCDKRSLRQIVLNLVSNAIKYTPEGGQITITTALDKSAQIVFRVRDTGIGMSDSDIKQAMKPFQRLDTILKHETNGSGLGLPLTKALIEANDATFKIESAVDKGTVASVMFSR